MKYEWLEFNRGYQALCEGEKAPRKLKKAIIGKRVSKNKLRKMLADTTIVRQKYPEPSLIDPYKFCPFCGCDASYIENHGVPYPEIYETEYCLRCHKEIGGSDNSPYYHILEDIIDPINADFFD